MWTTCDNFVGQVDQVLISLPVLALHVTFSVVRDTSNFSVPNPYQFVSSQIVPCAVQLVVISLI